MRLYRRHHRCCLLVLIVVFILCNYPQSFIDSGSSPSVERLVWKYFVIPLESFFSLKFRQGFPGTLCSLKTHLYINMLCYEFWVADDLVLCFYSWFSCLCALITMFGGNKNHLTNVIPRCDKCCQIQLDCLRTLIEGLNLGYQRKFLICAKKKGPIGRSSPQ